ncbi:MAG: ABC transporter ATP-binding protein [Phycisphaerae bacterium]|nr:ABC transporter ATP-binding protein [Phycisphaerae bacterium]
MTAGPGTAPDDATRSMIELDGVSRRFGPVEAVRDLSFVVPRGVVCGFLGPNGAGKSTTIRMIAGAIAPDSGAVRIEGIDLALDRRRALASLGWLPEHAPLPPDLRVEETIDLRARLHGMRRAERRSAVDSAIDACRLAQVRRRLCGQLSKGFRQRAGLASAIVHGPSVLVLDEPTSGLDPGQIDEFRALVRELAGRTTILLSTHVLAEVAAICGSVVVIDRGSLLAQERIDGGATAARGATATSGASAGAGAAASIEALYRGLLGGRLP